MLLSGSGSCNISSVRILLDFNRTDFQIEELGEEDASYRDLVFHFKIKGNNLLLSPVNSRSVII